MLTLREITKENLIPVTDLQMEDSQAGFVEDNPDFVFLHRIMIDKNHQGKGYGVRSLELCVEEFKKEFPSIGCVELIHYPDNDRAAAVYEKASFKLTGGRVKSAPGRIERGSTDENRTYEVTRRRYY